MSKALLILLKEIYNTLTMILLIISNQMNASQAQAFNVYMGNIEECLDELNDR